MRVILILALAQGNRWKCTADKGSTIGGICADGAQIGAPDILVVVMEGQPPDAPPVAGPPVRGPPCVALASEQCRANPRRESQYTPVPDTYREEHQLGDHARLRLLTIAPLPLDGRLDASAETARQTAYKKRGHGQESPLADVSSRAPSPSARQQPVLVIDVFQIKGVRRTAIDSERHTTDEGVHNARQNNLPPNAPNEYLVHGEFKTGPDSSEAFRGHALLHDRRASCCWPLSKECIISKIQEFEGQLKVQFDKELAEMHSSRCSRVGDRLRKGTYRIGI